MDTMKSLYELRHDMDVTQGDVAAFAGVSVNAISMYENGIRTPSLNTAKKIASYFNVPVESIKFCQKKSKRGRKK